VRRGTTVALPLLLAVLSSSPAAALGMRVTPGTLSTALTSASPGDTLLLSRGVYAGPVQVTRPLTLRGEPGTILDGGGRGSVIEVTADGASLEDLEIRASGARVDKVDSGVHVMRAAHVQLRSLRIHDSLYGVNAERAPQLSVEHCALRGRTAPMDEDGEGNGLHLWYSPGAVIRDNDLTRFVDAIYLSFADDARIEGNRMHDGGRYGLHTMYCQGTRLIGNTFTHNVAGCAIMFSNHLRVERNLFLHNRGPRTYGVLLRDCSDGEFLDNQLVDNTVAVFMDNSNRNAIRGNLVQDNGWGVLMFSSCAGNVFATNSFVNNDYPVALDMRYTDNRFDDGVRGNYWSENAPYDLDGDGVGDTPYSPVSTFAFLSKREPDLSVLAHSPAVAALGVAERVLPALRPSEAVDRFPSVAPPRPAIGAGERAPAPRPVPAACVGFGALLGVGIAGLTRGRRPA
jgi:nitrous oxidase accessory protein